jgi:hypothetical protein
MKIKTEHYIILSLILLSILGGSMYYNTVLVDTQAYVPSVYFIQEHFLDGEELWEEDEERVLSSFAFKRPVEITIAAFIEPLVGVRNAYALINMFLYVFATLLTYYYTKKLFKEHISQDLIAYITAILFATSLPVIIYATRVLVDVAGYVTILLGLFLIDKFLEKQITWKHHLTISLVLGSFLLIRDAIVILYPYYMLRYFLKQYEQKEWNIRAHLISLVSLWPFALTLLPQFIFMYYFDVGFLLSGKGSMITAGKYSLQGWLKFIIVHCAAFHIAWLFAFLGIKSDKNSERRTFYTTYFLCAFVYLIGIQLVALTSPRFSMVLFPVLLALAACGIHKLSEHVAQKTKISAVTIMLLCVVCYALISFFGAWLYPAHGLIVEDAGGSAVLKAVFNELKIKSGWLFL